MSKTKNPTSVWILSKPITKKSEIYIYLLLLDTKGWLYNLDDDPLYIRWNECNSPPIGAEMHLIRTRTAECLALDEDLTWDTFERFLDGTNIGNQACGGTP